MQYGLAQAKARLSELTHLVDAGEDVVIAKHGRPSYRLVPVTGDGVQLCGRNSTPASAQPANDAALPASLADFAPALAAMRKKTRLPVSEGSFVAEWRLGDRY